MHESQFLMNRLWEMTDTEDDTHGLEKLFAQYFVGGLKGSGMHADFRWFNSRRLLHEMMQEASVRRAFEVERRIIKIWPASEICDQHRRFHVGQRQHRGDRRFMAGQSYGNETLMLEDKDARAYLRMWAPAGSNYEV